MIEYVKGDAVHPQGDGNKIVTHICNDIGAWGRGFVLSVSQTHPQAEKHYRNWYQLNPGFDEIPFKLGQVQFVQTKSDIVIANMIGQTGIFAKGGTPPIRYEALRECLKTVAIEAKKAHASVHMPRIGCGLAGGTWAEVEAVIQQTLVSAGVPVTVYDFEGTDARAIPWNK